LSAAYLKVPGGGGPAAPPRRGVRQAPPAGRRGAFGGRWGSRPARDGSDGGAWQPYGAAALATSTLETDCSDVHAALASRTPRLVVLDLRSPALLGRRVKEMIGGIAGRLDEGYSLSPGDT